jgi:hypothetical protein
VLETAEEPEGDERESPHDGGEGQESSEHAEQRIYKATKPRRDSGRCGLRLRSAFGADDHGGAPFRAMSSR